MAVNNKDKGSWVVLVFSFALLAPAAGTEGQSLSEPASRQRYEQHSWQEKGQELDRDRWGEASQRINGLKFEGEGVWREVGEGTPSGKALEDEEPERMQRLRMEGERKQRAARLAWEKRAEEIQMKWGEVRESSPTVYVAYTKNDDAFGGVDYERGLLEVGAIAPVLLQDAPVRIERLLSERLAFLLRGRSMPTVRDLQDQVRMPGTGRLITQAEIPEFSRYVVRSGEPPQSYTAPDGVRRLRKRIKIELVPDHLKTRVRQYLPYVQKAARVYEVEPELILAVIQTESVFNPRAVSPAGAVGLMQLVPGSGGLEASKLVYGEPRLLTTEELARPDKNIELGAAYLRILLRRHFGEYRTEPRKLLFLAIASYNCGPRRVKAALGKRDTKGLSSAEFYELLLRVVPRETQVYVQRVVRNMEHYESITGMAPGFGTCVACSSTGLPSAPAERFGFLRRCLLSFQAWAQPLSRWGRCSSSS